jgi:hypothetical protein
MPWFGGVRDIHMGTSWDYLKFKTKNTKILLMQVATGLLQLIKEIETGNITEDALFRGNSHFLSAETLQKLGFSYRNPNPVEKILFSLTYVEDCVLRSISARRITLISYQNNKVVYFTGTDLLKNKDKIIRIYLTLSAYKKHKADVYQQTEKSANLINVA